MTTEERATLLEAERRCVKRIRQALDAGAPTPEIPAFELIAVELALLRQDMKNG